MRIMPVNRPKSKPVIIIFVIKVKYLLSGSCENQIDIYRECCYLLDIPWFVRVSLSQKF